MKDNYNFPKWVTDDMKENFFEMWNCFGRTKKDYDAAFKNNKSPENGSTQTMREVSIKENFVTGEYFYKWNNLGWIYDGKEVWLVGVNTRKTIDY